MAEKVEPWFWVIAWLITILGVSGNAGVIYLIATKQHLQRKTNWFILSLATADLLVSLTYISRFSHVLENGFLYHHGLVGYQAGDTVVISLLVGH